MIEQNLSEMAGITQFCRKNRVFPVMTHSLGALVLLLAMPSFAQTAPDLSDATPAQSPPAPTNTPALGLSIGTKFMSGEPDRAENDCLVHWRGDWGLESDVEQLFMRDIWTYLGGVQVVGSRLIDIQSQKRTVAASATAERNTFGHLSYRVAILRQSFSRPNMISIRLRRL